jgi:hypothetical protein
MRNLYTLLAVCSFLAATNATASAQALGNPVLSFQQVTIPPNPSYWQIKGASSANNLPAGTTTVAFTFQFKKWDAAQAKWVTAITTQATTTAPGGTATIDTGWLALTPPAKGEQWRLYVDCTYVVGSMPPQSFPLNGNATQTQIPNP